MPTIDLSILNQRQTPAFYADTLANRPTAGFIGRIFVSTNTFEFYRDNGTGWDLIGGPGAGTITGSGAAGQVSYWNGASTITGSNDLFFDAVNGHLGINTTTPGTALDVHHDQSTLLQLNQTTGSNDTRIAFQNNGVALWRIGNFYNGTANDFGIFDVVGAVQPFTIKKNTQQVLIGGGSGGSGKLVVTSGASDNGVQIVSTNAPSLRIDNLSIGATKRVGLGIATALNNFIQGAVDGNFCIFNGTTSTPASMLFGVYDSGLTNVQEAARISFTRNFLIGGTTDNGNKLQVVGNSYISGNVAIATTSASYRLQIGDLTTNNSNKVVIATLATGVNGFYVYASSIIRAAIEHDYPNSITKFVGAYNSGTNIIAQDANLGHTILYSGSSSERMRIFASTGNIAINTTTDAGFKLDVNGSLRIGSGNESFSTSLSGVASRLFYGSQSVQSVLYANPQNTTQFSYCLPSSIGFITTTAGVSTVIGTSANQGSNGGSCQYYCGNNTLINGHRFFYSNAERFRIDNAGTTISDTGTINILSSALLNLDSNARGFLPPRMTTAQKTGIGTPATGLVVYDTTLNKLAVFTGVNWETVTSV
jgi:hypothetical protein